jgi:hypothetical protein
MDPGVLPSRSISIMAFESCHDDATQESYFVIVSALFDCFNTENLRVAKFVGCAPSATDSSSPRGYSRKCVFGYRLKDK